MTIIVLWFFFMFIVFWAMVGYPVFLVILSKLGLGKKHVKKKDFFPTVCVMVVAHNEEKVIKAKLENLFSLEYPKEKYSVVVASDYSTDLTDDIVCEFISEHPEHNLSLHKTVNHWGKTNAQNEAQKGVNAEILVMTDANTMFKSDAVTELVSCFSEDDVAYVCGKTVFTNEDENSTTQSEGFYWKLDMKCRAIESKLQTITAGDGGIYACRNKYYHDIPLIECHDSSFPVDFALSGMRALFNENAIAYEKSGESDGDEYKRKVRMNRNIFHNILPSFRILNFFKYKWFSVFYFGHRTCRYLLWLAHLMVLLLNIWLLFYGWMWKWVLLLQVLFYFVASVGWGAKCENRWVKLCTYYCMTVVAQWAGVVNIVAGRTKAVWDKADSTR